MKKTPRGGNALLILNVHLEHQTQNTNNHFNQFYMERGLA